MRSRPSRRSSTPRRTRRRPPTSRSRRCAPPSRRYTLIDGLSARTQGSHGVLVTVSERRTAVRLDVGGAMIPLDSSGAVITGLRHSPHVATVRSAHLPVGGRSRDPLVALALRVLGAAPAPLRARVVAVTVPHGELTVYLHRGPRLIFGDARCRTRSGTRPRPCSPTTGRWARATSTCGCPGARPRRSRIRTRASRPRGRAATLAAGGLATAATALSPAVLGLSSST